MVVETSPTPPSLLPLKKQLSSNIYKATPIATIFQQQQAAGGHHALKRINHNGEVVAAPVSAGERRSDPGKQDLLKVGTAVDEQGGTGTTDETHTRSSVPLYIESVCVEVNEATAGAKEDEGHSVTAQNSRPHSCSNNNNIYPPLTGGMAMRTPSIEVPSTSPQTKSPT